MKERAARTIDRYRMFRPGERVGVAVSGGADSVCLLMVLMELAPRYGLSLSVLHLNHNLRGEASRRDAAFVGDLALRLGLPFMARDLALPAGNVEQEGRRARLEFFASQLSEGSVDKVALGHTRGDQAETVLFRFLRGSASAGLAGIRPVTAPGIVRPLIEIDRAHVLEYLRARQIEWREDASNLSPEFARNRIRHHLLPQLAREWNPAITETLAHTAEWALAEEEYWKDEIDRLAAAHLTAREGAVLLGAEALQALPLAVARRLVRRTIEMVKGDTRGICFRHVESTLRLAGNPAGGRTAVPGVEIRRSFDWVRFALPGEPAPYTIALAVPGRAQVPGTNVLISLDIIDNSETSRSADCVYNNEMGWLDWDRLSGSPTLRSWQPGDRYQPAGVSDERKLKTLFQEARVPVWERALWPVLLDGNRIVWSRRFGASLECAAGPTSGAILRVREEAR